MAIDGMSEAELNPIETKYWVTHTVMPKLRKDGMFFAYPIIDEYYKNPKETLKKIDKELQTEIENMRRPLTHFKPKNAPKANWYNPEPVVKDTCPFSFKF